MDIRNWPLGQIMQLPDHCFGRKFPIILSNYSDNGVAHYAISEIGLPETCVLWEVWFYSIVGDPGFEGNRGGTVSVKLGDQLPATAAEFAALEDFFPEADEIVAGARVLRVSLNLKLRKPYAAAGRRIIARFTGQALSKADMVLGLVFSSIPTEVPDCLLSV